MNDITSHTHLSSLDHQAQEALALLGEIKALLEENNNLLAELNEQFADIEPDSDAAIEDDIDDPDHLFDSEIDDFDEL